MQAVCQAFIARLHGWPSPRRLFACPLACRESPCKILLLECGASESRVSPRRALDLVPPCASVPTWNCDLSEGRAGEITKTHAAPSQPFRPHGGISVSLHPEARSGWVGMVNDW